MVGMMRIELTTFCPPDKRANQAALHPDLMTSNILFFFHLSSRKWKFLWFFLFCPESFHCISFVNQGCTIFSEKIVEDFSNRKTSNAKSAVLKNAINTPAITILQYYLIFNFDAVGKLKDPISTTVEILNQYLTP